MSASHRKITFTLPITLVQELNRQFKLDERSKVVARSIEYALHMKKRTESLSVFENLRYSLPQARKRSIVEFIRKDRRSH